jgi:hypothetical protein
VHRWVWCRTLALLAHVVKPAFRLFRRYYRIKEKIHLFDKSRSFGFNRFGGAGRARWENDLLCWGWTVSSRCVGEKIQEL